MKALTFKRGIHPPEAKDQTKGSSITVIPPKPGAEMLFPLLQNTGAPAKPVVSVGDRVYIGQKIAESDGFMSVPVHSSVSGIVKAFRQTLLPTGTSSEAIVIENDGSDEDDDSQIANTHYTSLPADKIIALIKEAGIVGLGGAGFPTHVKLSPPKDKVIDTIIINASECEPYLTSDHRVLLEETDRFIRGIKVVRQIFPSAQAIIGIESNKPDAIDKLKSILSASDGIKVCVLKPKYPQGAEKQLIYSILKRQVPSGGLPADVGALVINVDTAIAIERAVVRRRPLIRKIVTTGGGAIAKPGNFKVRLGMTYRDFIEAAGGFLSEPYKMISGGPMMGVAMFTLDVPLIKVSSAFLCFTREEAILKPEQNCIRCGGCVDHCPMGLMPMILNENVLSNDMKAFEKNNGMECMECGSCAYVCPAGRHLTQSIRATRRHILMERRKR